MATPSTARLEIHVSRGDGTLTFFEMIGPTSTKLMTASIVSGCEGTGTPPGSYRAAKWIKDKTNPAHGRIPWSKDPWGNPYGPYFLPLNSSKTGTYTTYGIHGTRGPVAGNFEKPPLPQALVGFFVGQSEAKYLYCSHGCVRLSNQNISKLFELTAQPKYASKPIVVTIK